MAGFQAKAMDSQNHHRAQGRVLVIAGSDPSGGAGIQADLKTIAALGGYGASAITALTVQNTHGVRSVHLVPQDIIYGQIRAVLDDIGADAVKTGMLPDSETIDTVLKALQDSDYRGPLVVDPVMVATSGDRLIDEQAVAALRHKLLPRADVITPNLDEASLLLGHRIDDMLSMRAGGLQLTSFGAKSVVMKGGHADFTGSLMVDMLVTPVGLQEATHRKQHTIHTHGTGCTLASAIATGLATGQPLEAAWRRGLDFVAKAIELAPGLGGGHGPLGHAAAGLALGVAEEAVESV